MLSQQQIIDRLQFLAPIFLQVRDDSQLHQEHIDNPTGGLTHATITIVSEQFEGLIRIERHKLIYNALKDALAASLHALSLKTYTKSEWENLKQK